MKLILERPICHFDDYGGNSKGKRDEETISVSQDINPKKGRTTKVGPKTSRKWSYITYKPYNMALSIYR